MPMAVPGGSHQSGVVTALDLHADSRHSGGLRPVSDAPGKVRCMTPNDILATIGATFATFDLPAVVDAEVGDQYRHANQHPGGTRPAHALTTLEHPDVIEVFGLDEPTVALAARHIAGTHPYDQLVEASIGGEAWRVTRAWRVHRLAGRPPREMFARLIAAYGVEVTFGGLAPTVFLGSLSVPAFRGDPAGLFDVPGAQGRVIDVSAHIKVAEGGDIMLAWGYAFDREAYLRGATERAL